MIGLKFIGGTEIKKGGLVERSKKSPTYIPFKSLLYDRFFNAHLVTCAQEEQQTSLMYPQLLIIVGIV